MIPDTARIELEDDNGTLIGVVDVVPPFHVPQREMKLVAHEGSRYFYKLRRRSGAFDTDQDGERLGDAPVGSVPILCNDGLGGFAIKYLVIPPPKPFSDGEIQAMWDAIGTLPAPVPNSVRRDGLSTIGSVGAGLEPSVPALPKVLAIAAALAHRWPQKETIEPHWRPVDLAGGREDARTTLGRLSQADIFELGDGRRLPSRTARLLRSAEPWRLASLASVLKRVRDFLRTQKWEGGARPGDRLLSNAIAYAEPNDRRAVDPPLSSWPNALRDLHEAAIDFLGGATATIEGSAPAPLCHLWTLYESWVAVQVLTFLVAKLGTPTQHAKVVGRNSQQGVVWQASWKVGDIGQLHLWCQPEFKQGPRTGYPSIVSLTASLIPDVILAFQIGHEQWSVAAIDAKFRGTEKMTSGALGAAGAKYLWGLRFLGASSSFALQQVLIVASAGAGTMYHTKAAIEGVAATPADLIEFDSKIASLVRSLGIPISD